jgi:hypothetical protein
MENYQEKLDNLMPELDYVIKRRQGLDKLRQSANLHPVEVIQLTRWHGAFAQAESSMLHLELVYRRLLMGQEFLRKSGMRNQETQTELNETGNSNVKLKRLRKVRTKEATRDQMNSESVLTGEKSKTIWRVYSQSPPRQGQATYSTQNL